jgi:hypothetical protein
LSNADISTLSQLEGALDSARGSSPLNSISQFTAEDFGGFLEGFYKVLDAHMEAFASGPQFFPKDAYGEDRVTFFLTLLLKTSGYTVTRDEKAGNPDMVLSWNGHSWIGEAKIYKGPASILEGWLQLTTRYSSGTKRQCTGGVLCYFYGENALAARNDWRERLSQEEEGVTLSDCHLDPIAFRTSHNHRKTGLPFQVRHSFAILSHDPQDRSGRSRR